MTLASTIIDVRNLKRSAQLRKEPDQEKVANILENILKDSVIAQASGSRFLQKKALEELKQIRQDLTLGQINAGSRTSAMAGLYSHLLDQMNSMQDENKKSSSAATDAFKELSNSIPSADTFVSALITANPLIGFGVKISRDIYRSTKAYNQKRAAEQEERMKMLKDQEQYIQDQINAVKMEEEAAKERLALAEEEKKKMQDEVLDPESDDDEESFTEAILLLEDILDNIQKEVHECRKELVKLNQIWGGDSVMPDSGTSAIITDGEGSPIDNTFNRTIEQQLQDISDNIVEQTKQDKELSLDKIHEQEKLKQMDQRDKRLDDFSNNDDHVSKPDLKPISDGIDKEKGGFLKLLEGLISPLLLLVRGGIFGFAAAAVTFFAEIVAIPAMIGVAIYKFLDGFFNAEKIIGKASSDISMLDRVKAGVANIWGTILKIVDWVTNLFGFDFFDSKDIEKKIYKVFDNAQDKIVSTFNKTVDYVADTYKSLTQSVKGFIDDIYGIVDSVGVFIRGKYEQLTKFFSDVANKGVFETFKSLLFQDSPVSVPSGEAGGVNGTTPNASGWRIFGGWGDDKAPSPAVPVQPLEHQKNNSQWRGDVPLTEDQQYRGDVPLMGNEQSAPQMGNIPNANNNLDYKQRNKEAIADTMRRAEINAQKQNQSPAPSVNAPTVNNNNINNNTIMGGPSTSNPDPAFGNMKGPNRSLAF